MCVCISLRVFLAAIFNSTWMFTKMRKRMKRNTLWLMAAQSFHVWYWYTSYAIYYSWTASRVNPEWILDQIRKREIYDRNYQLLRSKCRNIVDRDDTESIGACCVRLFFFFFTDVDSKMKVHNIVILSSLQFNGCVACVISLSAYNVIIPNTF